MNLPENHAMNMQTSRRLRTRASFALAIQWHPEWNALRDPSSRALFEAFGAACRKFSKWRATSVDAMQARFA